LTHALVYGVRPCDEPFARGIALVRGPVCVLPYEADNSQCLLVSYPTHGAPGIEGHGEARLGLPYVADAGDNALVQQGISDRAARVLTTQTSKKQRRIEARAEYIRPEAGEASIRAQAQIAHELEDGTVELDDLPCLGAQHQPSSMARAAPRPATFVHTPHAAHAQVRVQGEVSLEADQQVLAARIRAANRATRESLGPALGLVAQLRGEDLIGHMARERRIDASSGMVDGVALGHPCKDAPIVIPQTVLVVVAGPFADRLGAADVARAIGDGLMAGGLPEPDLCPLEEGSAGTSPDEIRARLEALDFDTRMRRARAVVLAERALTEDRLRGSTTFEIATRARQGGVPAYAVTGENALDPFDARILDLQVILEASPTRRALLAAGRKLTQAV
jgi:hypothetical protein